jgi:hypothetical protein
MNLSEFKKAAKDRISFLENDRINHAQDYEIEGVGVIKLSPPLPKDVYNIIMNHTGNVQVEGQAGLISDATIELFKVVIRACAIEPIFDDEGLEILIDILGIRINEVLEVCFKLINQESIVDEKISDVENFTNETGGSTSGPVQP